MTAVSVIIPAYNQAHYLDAAIRSVLAQTFRDLEVLVVDDGSTDETPEVASSFSDRRVRYIRQENRGLSAARNLGIRRSSGAHLTFLDSDDLFLPRKLECLMARMDQDPHLGLVAGHAILIDEAGRELSEVFDRPIPADLSELLLGNPLHVGSVLLRRSWQDEVGPFDERLRSYEDWDMWLRLAHAGCPMASVPEPVSMYRFHVRQMTRIGRQMTVSTFAVLDKLYRQDSLPDSWKAKRDEAYSRAHLRAAAQAYSAGDFPEAKGRMRDAIRLDNRLVANDGAAVAGLAAGWANHAKTLEPIAFLEDVYRNLPQELECLRRRRNHELASLALHQAFIAFERGRSRRARHALGRAVRYRPRILLNRGVIAMAIDAGLGRSRKRSALTAQRI